MRDRKLFHALLRKQHYGIIGRHSAVKVCEWTRRSITDRDFCYKQKFYGINSHRCVQMTPSLGFCQNNCIHCWRETQYSLENSFDDIKIDEPESIVENSIEMQRKLLSGFGGNPKTNPEKFAEAQNPVHFAISLSGEPTMYPKINQLISEISSRNFTSFLVTNAMLPERLKRIEMPTQLYISLNACNRKMFNIIERPLYTDAWERLNQSLEILSGMESLTRRVLRITLIKGYNMKEIKEWAALVNTADPDFIEVKAYMFVGSSRQRLVIGNMPLHSDVQRFAAELAKSTRYKYSDEKQNSRVVLLAKENGIERLIKTKYFLD